MVQNVRPMSNTAVYGCGYLLIGPLLGDKQIRIASGMGCFHFSRVYRHLCFRKSTFDTWHRLDLLGLGDFWDHISLEPVPQDATRWWIYNSRST